MRWTCVECGSDAEGLRPGWCPRCGAVSSFFPPVRSPGFRAPYRAPVQACDLAVGPRAPSLGSPWDDLGVIGRPLKLVLFGGAGSGKTTQLLRLGDAFASRWGVSVLFDAFDEGLESISFRRRLRALEIRQIYLVTAGWAELSLELGNSRWGVVIVDSATRLGLVPGELDSYIRSNDLTVAVSLEVTKAGDFAGPASWSHWSDILLRAEDFGLFVEKNRYGSCGQTLRFPFFRELAEPELSRKVEAES